MLYSSRCITDPQQVVDLLEYHSADSTDSADDATIDYVSLEAMWEISLGQYLYSQGDNSETSDAPAECQDITTPARKFLRALTGSKYLPVQSIKIKVSCSARCLPCVS